jgi:hypothetical protein
VRVGYDDGDFGFRVVDEVVAQLVADLMRRQGSRQYAVVGESPANPEERRTEQQQ